jgi:hypothetical protein
MAEKAYFSLAQLFDDVKFDNGQTVQLTLSSIKVAGVEQLTAAFFAEVIPAFINPHTTNLWEFGDCTVSGSYPNPTSFSACSVAGIPNTWNPFAAAFLCNYSTTVGGLKRGEITTSVSTSVYGLEGFAFGFDVDAVPINDVAGGGSTGTAFSEGVFYLDIDYTQDFEMDINIQIKNSSGTTITDKTHVYSHLKDNCAFQYIITDNLAVSSVDATQVAFLTGGLQGWLSPTCSSNPDTDCDPIVTQSIAFLASKPVTPISTIGALQGCCYKSPVLADLADSADWKNDISGFLFKRNFSSETITLTLEKNGGVALGGTDISLIDNTYGTYYDFGSISAYPNYKGYKLEWRNVLNVQGEGSYRLRVDGVYVSGSVTEYSIVYDLKPYSEERANGTFRVQSVMNGYLKHKDFDYKGLDWVDGLRVRGFFGNRQAEYEEERVIFTNRESKQIRSELFNTYVCQTMHIPSCITDAIIEYHNFANKLYFTDYNYRNHKTTYVQKEVIFDTMETIDYKDVTDYVMVQMNYKDFVQNYQKTNC